MTCHYINQCFITWKLHGSHDANAYYAYLSYICTPHFADDLIKNVLKNPQFNLEEVDTDMLQRLSRSFDSDSGDLNIISMRKEEDASGAQNPQLFSISTRLGHQLIQSLTAHSIAARERWEYKHLVMLGRQMRGRSASAPLPTLPILKVYLRYRSHTFDIEDVWLRYRRYNVILNIEVHIFDIDAHNSTFDIKALSSISKVEKDIRYRVITFESLISCVYDMGYDINKRMLRYRSFKKPIS